LWREADLPARAKEDAAKKLGLSVFPSNVNLIWSVLMSVPEYHNRMAPVAAMMLWPSERYPAPIIQAVLDEPPLLKATRTQPTQASTSSETPQNGQATGLTTNAPERMGR
jgi:hypothetical protein